MIKLPCGDVLAGSLTYQDDISEPAPVAILITGSSPHDSGVGESRGGDISKMTTKERAQDIEECVRYIKKRNEFDSSGICLIGLSEGASITHMIASKDKSIKGIVLLAGIGSKGKDIVDYQIKNGLISESNLHKMIKQR